MKITTAQQLAQLVAVRELVAILVLVMVQALVPAQVLVAVRELVAILVLVMAQALVIALGAITAQIQAPTNPTPLYPIPQHRPTTYHPRN